MCEIARDKKGSLPTQKLAGGGINIEIRCKKTGKPITISNEYGMFCEDLCDLQESKEAKKKLDKMMKGIFKGIF